MYSLKGLLDIVIEGLWQVIQLRMHKKALGRGIFDFLLRGSRRVLRNLLGKGRQIKKPLVWPPIGDRDALSDVMNRLCWHLPENPEINPEIIVPLSDELHSQGLDVSSLKPPEGQHNYIKPTEHIRFVKGSGAGKLLRESDQILIRDWSYLKKLRILKHLRKVSIIDQNYLQGVELADYPLLYQAMMSPETKRKHLESSRKNYKRLIEEVGAFRDAYLFLTGPSLDRAFEFTFPENALKITCNEAIVNKKLVEHIKPHIYMLADPIPFGPSLYAEELRRHMIETVRKCNAYVVVPEIQVPLLLSHYPELSERLIGMPVSHAARQWNFPTPERFFVKVTSNIFTLYMLPIASAIADNIFILGADGIPSSKDMKQDWAHSKALSHFQHFMKTAIDTHPTFSSAIDYGYLYRKHCRTVEDLVGFGESEGKKYYTLAESYIPALRERLWQARKD